jgi:hypothetical protein
MLLTLTQRGLGLADKLTTCPWQDQRQQANQQQLASKAHDFQ